MRESKGLMGLPAPPLGYDGVVQTPGGPIEVVDGVMTLGKNKLDVSVAGEVTDPAGKVIAHVENGKLVPPKGQQQQQAPQGNPVDMARA